MRHAGSYFPDQGSNLCPLQWKPRALTTAPPGKSPKVTQLNKCEKQVRIQAA